MDYMDFTEEQLLTFFVKCNANECVIQLLEYVTVGTLKEEICKNFGIAVDKQIIEGWFRAPENDSTILNFCADSMDLNCLTVRSTSIDSPNNFSPTLTKNEELELEAVNDFLNQVLLNLPTSTIQFHSCRLKDAITEKCISPRKLLLLYLHNKCDEFASTFWRNLQKPHITNLINKYFFILGWSIENTKYHSALNAALNEYCLCVVKNLVDRKSGAALCLVPKDDSVEIYSCMRGKYSDTDFFTTLQKAIEFTYGEISDMHFVDNTTDANEREIQNMTSRQIQQLFADMLSNRDYNGFEYDQHKYLKDDIAYALKGPPDSVNGYNREITQEVEKLYKKILKNSNTFSQYTDKIEISFIYNCLEPEECTPKSIVNPIPIFVIRKCLESDNPCRIFVDHTERVYENWEDYIKNVKLPECAMVLPKNGRYNFDNNGQVLLERHLSPACSIGTKILRGFDIGTSVAGVASTGAMVTASLVPAVAALPFILVPAMVTGAAAGVYSIVRSSQTLHDRVTHQETVSFTNSEARAAYLNITAGSLGFVGAGTNLLVSQLVTQGINIGKGARLAINVVNMANVSAGGASLINSTVDVFDQWLNKNQPPSALTILQLSSSILFFGHAVINFQTAGTMIEEMQARTLQDYRDSLRSNRHRKTFNKLLKETIRRNDGNAAQGQAEIISTLRNIHSKDEVFAVLTRSNKQLNEQGIKFHAENGQIKLNGISIDMTEFATMNKKEINNFLATLPAQPDPTIAETSSMKDLFTTNNLKIPDAQIVATHAIKLLGRFQGDIKNDIIRLLAQILASLSKPVSNLLDRFFPGFTKYMYMIDMVLGYFIKLTKSYEGWLKNDIHTANDELYKKMKNYVVWDRETLENIQQVIRFSCELNQFKEETLKRVLNYFHTWIAKKVADYQEDYETKEKRECHSAKYSRRRPTACKKCGGHYYQ